jgi:hypothetical protein
MHCQQDTDADADYAAKIYQEQIEEEQREEDVARAMQDAWRSETAQDRAATERSDEKVARRRYNAEEVDNVNAASLAQNRGKRSATKDYVCKGYGNRYTTMSSLRRHQLKCEYGSDTD